MQKKKNNVFISIIVLIAVVCFLLGIVSNEILALIPAVFLIFTVIGFCYFELKENFDRRKKQKIITKIQIHDNKNLYEKFILEVNEGLAKEKLNKYLNKNDKEILYDLSVFFDTKDVKISYMYKDFKVKMAITSDAIVSQIDSPVRYDLLEANEVLEKKQKTNFNLNAFLSLDDLYEFILNRMNEEQLKVQAFIQNNKPDNVVNGSTISKAENYKNQNIAHVWICFVVGTLFIALIIVLIIIALFKDDFNDYFYFFEMGLIIIVLGVVTWRDSYRVFSFMNNLKKDLQEKTAIKIKGTCVKVSFFTEGKRRSRDREFKLLKLTINTNEGKQKVYIIVNEEYLGFTLKRQQLRQLLLNSNYTFYCLKRSKAVIKGDREVLNHIKSCAKMYAV